MKKLSWALDILKQKKWRGLVVCLGVLVAIFAVWLLYRMAQDCVEKYAMDDYFISTIASTNESVEDLTLNFVDQAGYGVYDITIPYTLDAGSYQLTIDYTAADADFFVYVATTNEYDLQQNSYPVFATGTLLSDQTSLTLTFDLDETHYLVTAYLVYADVGSIEITKTTWESLTPVSIDRYARPVFYLLLLVSFIAALAIACRKGTKNPRKIRVGIVLCVAAVAFVTSYPILQMNEVVYGHDAFFHMSRITGLYQELVSGHFPARLTSMFNSGYGYLNSALYPELFLYLPALLMFTGVSPEFAQNVLIVLINILCPALAYYSFVKITKNSYIALGTTALYAMSVYRLSNLYVRAALGEFLFLTFLPLMLYGIYHLFCENGKRWWLIALAATCILQSHILGTAFTAVIFGVFLLVLFGVRLYQKKPVLPAFLGLVKAGVVTVLLNFWFLVPFLYYFMVGNLALFDTEYEFTTHFMPNLVSVGDIFSFDMAKGVNNVRLSLGAFLFAVFLSCVAGWLVWQAVALKAHFGKKSTMQTQRKPVDALEGVLGENAVVKSVQDVFIWCSFALIVFFAWIASNEALWNVLSQCSVCKAIAANIQYSFRLIGLIVFCICVIFAFLTLRLPKPRLKNWVGGIVFVCAFVSCSYTLHNDYILTMQDVYNTIFLDSPPEYLLDGTDYAQELSVYDKVQTSSEYLVLTAYDKENCVITFTYENQSDETQDIRLPLFYYEGYTATLTTGENLPVTCGVNNVLHVIIPPNSSGTVCVEYQDRWFFRVGNLISLATLICTLLWCVLLCYFRRHPNTLLQLQHRLPWKKTRVLK